MPLGGKIPGQDYTKSDAATFYQANSVVETDYDLQVFSGRFYPGTYAGLSNTITDFNLDGTPFANVVYQPLPLPAAGQPPFQGQTSYNMGGCMGCHGNAQQGGADFSFILFGGPVKAPDAAPGGNGGFGGTLVQRGSGVGAAAPSGEGRMGAKIIQKYHLHP